MEPHASQLALVPGQGPRDAVEAGDDANLSDAGGSDAACSLRTTSDIITPTKLSRSGQAWLNGKQAMSECEKE